VLGSVLNDGCRDGLAQHAAQLPPEAAERAGDSLAFVVQAADRFGPAGQELLGAARQSFVDGFNTTIVVASLVMAAGAPVVFGRGRRPDDRGRALYATAEPGRPGSDVAAAVRSVATPDTVLPEPAAVDAAPPGAAGHRPVSPAARP
jgi:hypothetical protein